MLYYTPWRSSHKKGVMKSFWPHGPDAYEVVRVETLVSCPTVHKQHLSNVMVTS